MSKIFIYYNASNTSQVNLLLDDYPATQAFSLMKIKSDYTGYAIRVRRDSDNNETDIGFDGNDLDITSLLSFVGSSNGFVVIWYDQMEIKNFTQTTSSFQPKIVSSGVLEEQNGKAAINQPFDTGLDMQVGTIYTSINATDGSIYSVTSLFNDGSVRDPMFLSEFDNASYLLFSRTQNTASSSPALLEAYINSVLTDVSTRQDVQDELTGQRSLIGINGYDLNQFNNIETNRKSSPIVGFDYHQELIIYASNQINNLTEIQNNINSRYVIY